MIEINNVGLYYLLVTSVSSTISFLITLAIMNIDIRERMKPPTYVLIKMALSLTIGLVIGLSLFKLV